MTIIEESQSLILRATALKVSSPPTRHDAANLWDLLRSARKHAEAQKETACRHLKTAWDEAKVPYDKFVKECHGHEATLQQAMSAWDTEQDRLARLEHNRMTDRQ